MTAADFPKGSAPAPFWTLEPFFMLRLGLILEALARLVRRLGGGGLAVDSLP